jgi:hypothetical protein
MRHNHVAVPASIEVFSSGCYMAGDRTAALGRSATFDADRRPRPESDFRLLSHIQRTTYLDAEMWTVLSSLQWPSSN